jgi:hypothetical protein
MKKILWALVAVFTLAGVATPVVEAWPVVPYAWRARNRATYGYARPVRAYRNGYYPYGYGYNGGYYYGPRNYYRTGYRPYYNAYGSGYYYNGW